VEISDAVARYRDAERISARERAAKLQKIIDQAKDLHSTLAGLDSGSLRAVIAPVMASRFAIDPRILVPKLKMLVVQTECAKRRAAPPRRGPHGLDPSLRQLIAELGIIWKSENPTLKGIVASKDERRGPMLDFVWNELRKARIRVQSKGRAQSKDALGKLLYSMRERIAEKAAEVRRRKTVTHEEGHTIIT
jgi:hypothetical protein